MCIDICTGAFMKTCMDMCTAGIEQHIPGPSPKPTQLTPPNEWPDRYHQRPLSGTGQGPEVPHGRDAPLGAACTLGLVVCCTARSSGDLIVSADGPQGQLVLF